MDSHPASHPSADVLLALGAGRLDDATAAGIFAHLDGCPQCAKAATGLSGDGVLRRLRAARGPGATPSPSQLLSGVPVARPVDPSLSTTPAGPPELHDLPQYEVIRELGRGGMGVVYLAKNKLMDRLEVLKVVNRQMLGDAAAAERFLREIRSAAQLSHPNIVTAYAALRAGDLLLFAMEYVKGEDLARVVKARGPLPVANACYYVQRAALGLQHAFEKGMVHRDIKPQNLILAVEGEKQIVKVLDFGLAKATQARGEEHRGLTDTGRMLGTPDYMAPEQMQDAAHADIRADVYGLGCTLYFLLTGRPPFRASSLYALMHAHMTEEAAALDQVRPDVPAELAAVAAKMMAKDPARRYQKPGEAAQALAPFIKAGVRRPPPAGSPPATAGTTPGARTEARKDTMASPAAASPEWLSFVQEVEAKKEAVTPSPAGRRTKAPGGIFQAETVMGAAPPRPSRQKRGRKWWIAAAAVAALLLAGGVAVWAVAVFRVKTADGVLVVQVNEPNAEVFVDGDRMTVSWSDGGKKAEIHVKPGVRKVEVKKDGFSVDGKELTFKDGDREVFTARLLPEQAARADAPLPEKSPPPDAPPEKSPPPDTKKPDAPPVASAADDDKGFAPLFNGKDLTGWTSLNGTPAEWGIKEGYVEVDSAKGDIRTKETFGPDFKLHVEFWLPLMPDATGQARANSGVFLQGRYEVQILDSYRNDTFADGSVGALYRLIAPDKEALQKAIRPPEQWQSYDITFHAPRLDKTGKVTQKGRITVVLNDVAVINDGQFDKATPGGFEDMLGAPGPIRLQAHGAKVRFRNIGIKALPLAEAAAPPAPAAEGFVPLFDGKDLKGWKTHPSQPGKWRVEQGILIGSSNSVSHLYTDRGDYTDFYLRLEARINDGGNSGVYFRAPYGPNLPADKPTWIGAYNAKIHAPRFGGLLIDPNPELHRTRETVLRPGEWITFEIIAEGNHFVIKVNGETTSDYTDEQRLYARGHIVLQQHGAATVVEFRKIEIKELPAKP